MQARYYDPVIGRFYSNDPLDFSGHSANGNLIHGFNRYVYANNNPYKFTDPTGLSGEYVSGQCGENDKYPVGNEYKEIVESNLTDTQIETYNELQKQILKNKFVGKTAEQMAADHVKANNPEAEVGIGGVTLKVMGAVRYPDLTVKHPDGTIEFIEVKANLAIPTKKQITRDSLIQSGGGVVTTSKHGFLPVGIIGPTNVDLINVIVPVK